MTKTIGLLSYMLLIFSETLLSAEAIDIDKNSNLFNVIFGQEMKAVKASRTNDDDEKLGLKLIKKASALESKPHFQIYIKMQAAYLLLNSKENKKIARVLLVEVLPSLPDIENNKVWKQLILLQIKIVKSTSKKDKSKYLDEINVLADLSQKNSNRLVNLNKFTDATTNLRDAQRYIRSVDKSTYSLMNKKIAIINKMKKRFNLIKASLNSLKTNPNNIKSNEFIAKYYLLEKSNLIQSLPFLEKATDKVLASFYKNISDCLDDGKLKTPDGISLSTYPMIDINPNYYLNWLSKKNLEDPTNIIDGQLKRLQSNKPIQLNKINLIVTNTVKIFGKEQSTTAKNYFDLAIDFENLIKLVNNPKLYAQVLIENLTEQFVTNKLIALTKSKLKMIQAGSIDEVAKLKIEMELGVCKEKIAELKIEPFDIDKNTPFTFQQISISIDPIQSKPIGLQFRWNSGASKRSTSSPYTWRLGKHTLTQKGQAKVGRKNWLHFTEGSLTASKKTADKLGQACKKTNEITIQAIISTSTLDQIGPARIISFSKSSSERNFTLGQSSDFLILRLRTPNTGANGSSPESKLCKIKKDVPSHIIVTYRNGELVCYQNGKLVSTKKNIQGGFENWIPQTLIFGNEATGSRNWKGSVGAISIYNRFMTADEAKSNYKLAKKSYKIP
ncbi:MAG: hypothetical protein COA79_23915 [Planctomycetota bacterium]|nr:MAG: hypothetical protein COA79_23915 [Planctomycetota bacterium]